MLSSSLSVYTYIMLTRDPWNQWMHNNYNYIRDWDFSDPAEHSQDLVESLSASTTGVLDEAQELIDKRI